MNNLRTLITTVLLLMAASAYVQSQDRPLLTATVPFSFAAQDTNLPAGAYTVSVLPPFNMIKLQSVDGGKVAMISAIPSRTSEGSPVAKLVFHRLGNHYFLAQIWEQGSDVHRDLQSGKLARELARNGEKVQSATILAGASSLR